MNTNKDETRVHGLPPFAHLWIARIAIIIASLIATLSITFARIAQGAPARPAAMPTDVER